MDKGEDYTPLKFDEFIGQNKVKQELGRIISKNVREDGVIEHLMLTGPLGYGKSTLAKIIAQERGVEFHGPIAGAQIEDLKVLYEVFDKIGPGDILFIDEIHGVKNNVMDLLNIVMTTYRYKRIEKLKGQVIITDTAVPRFTLIGATTNIGIIEEKRKPFLSRFKRIDLERYNVEDLTKIVLANANYLKILIDVEGAKEIARRSLLTPRTAIRHLKDADYYDWEKTPSILDRKVINRKIVMDTLSSLRIDEIGLNQEQRDYMSFLARELGGPIGIKNIAHSLGKEQKVVERIIEPPLMVLELVRITQKGREYTAGGFDYAERFLGIKREDMVKIYKGEERGGHGTIPDELTIIMPSENVDINSGIKCKKCGIPLTIPENIKRGLCAGCRQMLGE